MVLFVAHTKVTLVLAGLVALAAGTAVALNYRGAADRMPPNMGVSAIWSDGSRASTRKTFGAVALWGLFLIVFALERR